MRTRSRFLATLAATAAAALTLLAGGAPVATAALPSRDWITVDQVLVNRLGGVNVSGQVSCAGAYDKLVNGQLSYQDENGNWAPIPVPADDDRVNLAANSDEYTVSQAAGRKAMIVVSHGSSQMSPCFAQDPGIDPGGMTWPDWVQCSADGTSCRWETMHYSYDRDALGPLFDYSPNGKFKTGNVAVEASSIGLLVMVHHGDGSWDTWYSPEGSYSYTSTVVRAVSYR